MIILILALLFGAAVTAFLIGSLIWAKRRGRSSKLTTVLKLVILAESVVFLGVFIFVLIRTLAM